MNIVPFEIAKKLKEKGFKEECLSYYTTEYTLYNNEITLTDDKYLCLSKINYEEFLVSHNSIKYTNGNYVDAPTIDQVLEWLREERDIDIVIYPIDRNTIYMGGEKYILSIYFCGKRDYKIHKDNNDKFVKWEDAAIAGIEYVINNSI